jgi:hypothetical protein
MVWYGILVNSKSIAHVWSSPLSDLIPTPSHNYSNNHHNPSSSQSHSIYQSIYPSPLSIIIPALPLQLRPPSLLQPASSLRSRPTSASAALRHPTATPHKRHSPSTIQDKDPREPRPTESLKNRLEQHKSPRCSSPPHCCASGKQTHGAPFVLTLLPVSIRPPADKMSWRKTDKLMDTIKHYSGFPATGVSLRQMVQFGESPSTGTSNCY